ncbi:MAG: site-2 protease family protein [Chloroflexota bacterium]
MRASVRIGRIAGIDIGIHYTWALAFILIAWSLAQGFFPAYYSGWSQAAYWITGIVAALLLFVSVLLHELSHSLVGKARGMNVRSITLFIFGGVSNLEDEPERPSAEFAMTIVGPGASFVLAGIFWGLSMVVPDERGPVAAMLLYLALINGILGGFNLLPAFPLDGGRVLRSILWRSTGDLSKATNIAATIGRLFGWALIAFGVFELFTGNLLGGLWIAFIGWFLSSGADASRRELTVREHLGGAKVSEVMDSSIEVVSPATSVEELVDGIFHRYRRRALPVSRDGRVVGIVTVSDIKELPREQWANTPVQQIMTRAPLHSVSPDDDLYGAMQKLTRNDINQVVVLRGDELAGMLTRADIVNFLQTREELGIRRKARR